MTQPRTTASDPQTGRPASAGAAPRRRGVSRRALLAAAVAAGAFGVIGGGCAPGPRVLEPEKRLTIDRSLVEVPAGFELERYADGLDGPVAFAFDGDGNLIVAEGALDGGEPKIYGFTPDRKRFDVYPPRRSVLPFGLGGGDKFRMYGPVGGLAFHAGHLYVSHRDEDDFGVITALDYKGGHRTVVAGLPARGEHGVTGIAIDAQQGRIYFGVGSATNAGLVGPDDLEMGWAKSHPDVHDVPYTPYDPDRKASKEYVLWGRRMNSKNPAAWGLMPDLAVTGPFQPFGTSIKTRIKGAGADNPKCNAAILSARVDGGDLKVEAHGVRLPKGLAITPLGALHFTNQGMELRGSRPVKDDPDSLLQLFGRATWYGWPDYSTDLRPITDEFFQPPMDLITPTGYPDLSFLINHPESRLRVADAQTAVSGVMPSQSGASGLDFVPAAGPFAREYGGSAVVALFGDRTPFSTSGRKTTGPVGFKVVRVDMGRQQVVEFVRNVKAGPSSAQGGSRDQLERPIDVKFGPDGALYILDYGQASVRGGSYRTEGRTGRIYRLMPAKANGGT